MRRITLLLPVLMLGSSACAVAVSGAPCETTDNCPFDEVCGEDLHCREAREGEVGNCRCTPGVTQRCAADGTRVTCVEDPVCPFFPAGAGEACEAPHTCVVSGTTASCACALVGDGEGAGCDSRGATSCTGDALLQCQAVGDCLLWRPVQNCAAQGFVCGESGDGTAQCVCPANPGDTFFADPVHGTGTAQGATGLAEPASCRFARVGDALEQAGRLGREASVVVTGYSHEAWKSDAHYKAQELVVPKPRNRWLYRANNKGRSGKQEPAWPLVQGATVKDGEIEWQNVGPDAVLLENEKFPLTVPPSVTLTTADCPAAGGNDCDALKYVLPFGLANGGDQATTAISLSPGASLSGLFVLDAGGRFDASAVDCTTGNVKVEDLWLHGAQTVTPRMRVGISVHGDCNATVRRGVVGLFSQAGILSETTGTVTLEQAELGTTGEQPLPVGVGLQIESGRVHALDTTVANALREGVTVNGSATEVTLTRSEVLRNGIDLNNPNASVPGVTVHQGLLLLQGTKLDGNGRAGLRIQGGKVVASAFNSAPTTFNQNGVQGQASSAGGAGVQVVAGEFEADSIVASGNRYQGVLLGAARARLDSPVIANNGEYGIVSQAAGQLTVNGGTIESNGLDNVHITDSGAATVATFSNAFIRDAKSGAGLMLLGGDVTLVGTIVSLNRLAGIDSAGGLGPKVTLTSSEISDNSGTGVNAVQGTWSLTASTIARNGKLSGVGMLIDRGAGLQAFSGNKLFANKRAQIRFERPTIPVVGAFDPWDFPGSTCDPLSANHVSCYPTGAVGIEAANQATVDAKGVYFQNRTPQSGTDYSGNVTWSCNVAAAVTCN